MIRPLDERRSPPRPVWRESRPLSRLLVLSWGGVNEVLDHCGPEFGPMDEIEALSVWFEGVDFGGDGLWESEVKIRTRRHEFLEGSTEYDTEIEVVTSRPASGETLRRWQFEGLAWDPGIWIENWDEIADWEASGE